MIFAWQRGEWGSKSANMPEVIYEKYGSDRYYPWMANGINFIMFKSSAWSYFALYAVLWRSFLRQKTKAKSQNCLAWYKYCLWNWPLFTNNFVLLLNCSFFLTEMCACTYVIWFYKKKLWKMMTQKEITFGNAFITTLT